MEVVFNLVIQFHFRVLDLVETCFILILLLLELASLQLLFLLGLYLLRSGMKLLKFVVFVARPFVWKLALHVLKDLLDFVLGPHKVDRSIVCFVRGFALDPPIPSFKETANHHRIIALSNIILVNHVLVRKLELAGR